VILDFWKGMAIEEFVGETWDFDLVKELKKQTG
jgi:hypothetical protein